jgi:integrase/recombinase XerD
MTTLSLPVSNDQLPLLVVPGQRGSRRPVPYPAGPLTRQSSLSSAMGAFYDHMQRQGFSDHTVQAFIADLRLLGKYAGLDTPIGRFGQRSLEDFLNWMVEYRGVPCSPKTYGRRVTTLKVFFGWLHETKILDRNPAVAIPHQRIVVPLPRILFDDQVAQLLAATEAWMTSDPQPDARAHLLVSLLLATGIKKGECVAIALSDLDRSRAHAPALFIRYASPRYRHKERRLPLPPAIVPALERYLADYRPRVRLFECTPRNLEYVLAEAGRRARLPLMVSFEMLRWTCAVRDFRDGMDERQLRDKLGLSPVSWHDTAERLRRLAALAR